MHTHVEKPRDARRWRVPIAPTTPLGRWAVGLSLAGIALLLVFRTLPAGSAVNGGPAFLALWIAGGVAALLAIVGRGERALLVFATLLPALVTVGFLIAEVVEFIRGL